MHTGGSAGLHAIRRHLAMLLIAFGWLFIQSQVAIASHDCQLDVQGEAVIAQHHHMMPETLTPSVHLAKAPLCDKHCVPDTAQKESGHFTPVALPVSVTLAVVAPVCIESPHEGWSLTPPATGAPATIRFCRFRE